MHTAWSSIEEVRYRFWRSSDQFQGSMGQNHADCDPNVAFRDCNFLLELTDCHEMMHIPWSRLDEMPYSFPRSPVKFQGHTGQKIADFDPNLACPDCNSRLNWPMAMKWCTKLQVVQKRWPSGFQGHPIKFKVTRYRKSPILTWIERFRIVTPVGIYWWLCNNAQSLM